MNRRPLLVLDPENSDATFGALEEAEIWMVKNGYNVWHTGVALKKSKIGERVSVSDLIEAARTVVSTFTNPNDSQLPLDGQRLDALIRLESLLERINEK
jgi:hypothetical protein